MDLVERVDSILKEFAGKLLAEGVRQCEDAFNKLLKGLDKGRRQS